LLQAQPNAGSGTCDFAGYEGFAAQRAFVVEEDAIAGMASR
jgi:hypothetical protein